MKKMEKHNEAKMRELTNAELKQVSGGSNANFPPGQFPPGNPAQAPGRSNPVQTGQP